MLAARRALLLAALAAPAVLRAQSVEVLDLRYRTADDLLPLLRPFVEAGGALSGEGSQLFVRTSPANLRQLRELLAQLDRPPRQLQITVRQERADEDTQRTVAADGSVIVSSRGTSGSASVQAGNSRTTATRSVGQTVRVLEGGRALIAFGVAIPFTFKQYVATPASAPGAAPGLTEIAATSYYEAVTGFAVRPLLAGEVVTLELSPTDAQVGPRGAERALLMTRVQGRLGQWIALGDADLAEQARRGAIASTDARSASSQRGVWVRVEDVTGR
jgi:hypothetical protein